MVRCVRSVVANINGLHASIIKTMVWLMPDRIRDKLVLSSF
jgi:hypothetical protein